jgi:hypothetical protein
MNRDVLCRPFPREAIRTRPGQHGKTLSYVDIAAVITRLNEGCDAWSFEVVSYKVEADEIHVLGKLRWTPWFGPRMVAAKVEPASRSSVSY